MKKIVFDFPVLVPSEWYDDYWLLVFDWTIVFRGECYRIPATFKTDGASIPRWLWWICGTPLKKPRLFAAIVHDYIYSGGDPEATRADADDLYRDIQIALGVSRWKAYVEWLALRLCGRSHWYNNKKGNRIMKKLILAAVCAAMAIAITGCGTPRLTDAEAQGMYVNAATETLAIGSGSVTTIPGDREASVGHYEEDTALLSPSTKTHKFDFFLVGTNSTQQAAEIVKAICKAYASVAPVISSNETAKTGITVYDLFKAKKAQSLEAIWGKLTPAAQAEIEKLVESDQNGTVPITTADGVKAEVRFEDGDCEVCEEPVAREVDSSGGGLAAGGEVKKPSGSD